MTDLESWARAQGIPWPLPEPEPGQPDLLMESLQRQYDGKQAAMRAYGPFAAGDWT